MTETSEQRRAWVEAAGLLLLSAGLRAAYAWAVPRMLDSADAIHYLETARSFAHGDFFNVNPKIPALYPVLTALTNFFLNDIEMAGQAVSFIFSALLVVPVYFLSLRLHGARIAPIAGCLVVTWPWLIDYSNRVATEPVAAFFWMTGVLCLVRGLDAKEYWGWMVGAALCFGALHLARAEGTFVLLGAIGAGAIAGWRNEPKQAVRKLGVYVLAAGVLLAVHAMYLHRLVGIWTVNYRVGFIGDRPEGSTVIAELGRTLIAMSADVPAVMLGPVLWAFFGVGVVAPAAKLPRVVRAEWMVFYFAVLQWLVVVPVLSPAPRYLMTTFVVLALWSARGIVGVSDLINERAALRRIRSLPLVIVLAWMAAHLGAAVVRERWDGGGLPPQPWEYKIVGEWMREHLEPGLIVTRKPQVGFYAGMPTIGAAAEADLNAVLAQAEEAGARYLVVDERYTAGLVPALRPLLNPASAPKSVRLVKDDLSPYAGGRVVVYAFAGRDGKNGNDGMNGRDGKD